MHYKLNVSYRDKDEAKKYGARWNVESKYWYYEGNQLPDGLKKWYPQQQSRLGEIFKPEQPENPFTKYQTVSDVCKELNNIFKTGYFVNVLVKGEITNFSRSGKTCYFSIMDSKDQDTTSASKLNCVAFEYVLNHLDFKLETGVKVGIKGNFTIYEKNGSFSLRVSEVVDLGKGEAEFLLKQLTEKLMAEGLFDPKYKKPIPKYPKRIGIITSSEGQAIQDFCKIARKRNRFIEIYVFDCKVQGQQAAQSIVEQLRIADTKGLDTLVIGRGGGSDEDLKAYNDETLVREVFKARTPIVSAVGHEGNWTLIDRVADQRAATPSEAAEITVPDIETDLRNIENLLASIQTRMWTIVKDKEKSLNNSVGRLELNTPKKMVERRIEKTNALMDRMRYQIDKIHNKNRNQFSSNVQVLLSNNPKNKMKQRLDSCLNAEKNMRLFLRQKMDSKSESLAFATKSLMLYQPEKKLEEYTKELQSTIKNIRNTTVRNFNVRVIDYKELFSNILGHKPQEEIKRRYIRANELDEGISEKIKIKYKNVDHQIRSELSVLDKFDPSRLYQQRNKEFLDRQKDLIRLANQSYKRVRDSVEKSILRLNGVSPTAKLVNGFGYISITEKPVKSVRDVNVNDTMTVTIHDGTIQTVVKDIINDNKGEE